MKRTPMETVIRNQQLTRLEAVAVAAQVFGEKVQLEPEQLVELVRVYRLATSQHMRECLLFGDTVGPGELLDALFPERAR